MSYQSKFTHLLLIVSSVVFLSSCGKSEQLPSTAILKSSSSVNVSDRDVNEHVKTALEQKRLT